MKRYLFLLIPTLLAFCSCYSQDTESLDKLLIDARYQDAVFASDEALKKNPPVATAITLKNKKAEAQIKLGKFDAALATLNETKTQADQSNLPLLQGATATNFGLLYLMQGRNDLALESLTSALNIFEQGGKSETLEAAQALAHLGNLYRATGKYAQAEEQLNRVLAIRQRYLKDNNELIAASYNDLGLVFSVTNADKALDYYEKALTIYQNLHGKEHPKIATANTNIGFVYRSLELYGDAVNNFESALKIWEKVYPQPHASKAFALFNLGATYSKMGDQKAARGYYERALKMYEDSYGNKHPEIARVLNALGDLDLAEDKFDVALSNYQRALQANIKDFNSADVQKNPNTKNFYDGNVLLNTMLSKAQAFEGRHFGKTLKFEDFTLSLQTLQVCDTLIEKLRQQITNESDKLSLGSVANEVYANGVRISFEAAQVAFRKKTYFESSFYFAEKSKSAVLLEAISDANAKSFAGIPADLLEEEKTLKTAIALCAQKLAQKPSEDEEKYLREASFSLNRSYEAFTRKLEAQFPEYFNLKFNAAAPSISQLQNKLNDRTALLSYFTDEKNNRLYIFQISKKKFSISDHALPKDFDRYITGLRNGLFFNDLKTYLRASGELSKILLPKKIPSSVNSLVILPVGRLSIIPFETLFSEEPNGTSTFNDLPYLIRKYSIRYEFSAGLILQKKQTQPSQAPAIFLCAPVSFPEKENLNELPGTEAEVKEIASLFAAKHYSSGLYTRAQADESRVKSPELKSFTHIHFATHGIVDESNPELSRIFLRSDVASEDGNLFAGEIYNLTLDANLVTLSACQTGLGKISKGEGVIGLSRALVYAGARNIIVSFWSVADESTAELMKDFYRQMLQEGKGDFSADLRDAKLNLIQNKKYSAPYYWAPFILIGF
jgi:CHAT domain-containing protein